MIGPETLRGPNRGIVIGASAGGVKPIRDLPSSRDLSPSLLIVLHLPASARACWWKSTRNAARCRFGSR